jgi:glyoxylase-like metal-dependent hydrolase (beta-lactamase superfamily II)
MTGEWPVSRHPGGPWHANSYLMRSPGGNALIIDAGEGVKDVLEAIRRDGLHTEAILCTHGHHDHVEAAAWARAATGAPLLIHGADRQLLRAASLYRRLFDGQGPVPTPEVDQDLEVAPKPLKLGPFVVDVIEAPGHTAGSVLLRIGSCLFTGDTLLPGAAGRTDLPGGEAAALERTLAKLVQLPRELRFFPGHRTPSTLGDELDRNPRLRALVAGPTAPLQVEVES